MQVSSRISEDDVFSRKQWEHHRSTALRLRELLQKGFCSKMDGRLQAQNGLRNLKEVLCKLLFHLILLEERKPKPKKQPSPINYKELTAKVPDLPCISVLPKGWWKKQPAPHCKRRSQDCPCAILMGPGSEERRRS
ncbi:hypothetical protein LUU34_00997900 [Aix galericulata]|nr:hypothetical protein LUU34_00997900 [Aix galericulata]